MIKIETICLCHSKKMNIFKYDNKGTIHLRTDGYLEAHSYAARE
jgi:hypothetical protein